MAEKRRLGLLGKMIFYYSFFLVILIFSLVTIAYQYVIKSSTATAQITQRQLADKLLLQVDGYFSEMDRVARQVAADTDITDFYQGLRQHPDRDDFFNADALAGAKIAGALARYNGLGTPVWRVSVYNRYGDYIYTGAAAQPTAPTGADRYPFPVGIDEMMQNLMARDDPLITRAEPDHWSNLYSDFEFISMMCPLTDQTGTRCLGVVEVQQNAERLKNIVKLDFLMDVTVFVLDRQGNPVVTADIPYGDIVGHPGYITTSLNSEKYGWTLVLAQNQRQAMQPYRQMIWLLYGGGIVVILCLIVAIILISRYFSAPIIALSHKVGVVSLDTVSTTMPGSHNIPEIQELNRAFTTMFQRLKDSLEAEKRSYLLALQSQMNPHFLYNTLSIISGMVVEGRHENAVEAASALSDMLRYSSSYDSTSTVLRDEMDNVCRYLQLMQLRFEHLFSYTVEGDESLRDMPIPRLVLQPFVENCFEHGFKTAAPPWNIHISTRREDDCWLIRIADNGSGISDEAIAAIEQKISAYSQDLSGHYHQMKIGGMGLANTITRLNLMLNGRVGWSLQHNNPTGTIVTLKFTNEG